MRLHIETYDSPAALFKRYGDALRGTLGHMPSDAADLPAFFENAERISREIQAPEKFRAQLLLPFLSEKARTLVSKMDQTCASSYKEVKTLILREYKMTPLVYCNRYQTATKQTSETYVMFVNRLKTLLEYYVASRNVTTFEKLISLLVADHVKPMLPRDCLDHVLAVENTVEQGWVTHDKLAEIVDAYVANHTPQMSNTATVSSTFSKPVYQQKSYDASANKSPVVKSDKPERRCYHCDSRMHLYKHCPHRKPQMPASVNASMVNPIEPVSSTLIDESVVRCVNDKPCTSTDDTVAETVHVTALPSSTDIQTALNIHIVFRTYQDFVL